ncbi:hypothetical protein E4U10_002991 [Claviceps purpurea]|nr:hypothetical protein E4U51_008536 [Claviceps purpurea]KAG6172750.1 hypothetical protein E4U11_002305 [Claviceps purpurea]KAG6194386.1 hypothetical protein E4U10_002991 [Claviceps purpurea]
MSSAQAMEEELQQSVRFSEDDRHDSGVGVGTQGSSFHSPPRFQDTNHEGSVSEDDELSDRDASGEDLDLDASGEEDDDLASRQQIVVGGAIPRAPDDQDNGEAEEEEVGDGEEGEEEEEDEEDEDEDEEGEEGDYEEDADVDDGDEGVGAVKVRPPQTDKGIESDDFEAVSADDDVDSDEEEEPEEPVWREREDADEDAEEESDAGPLHVCTFCKQDEENDPSEDFEMYLACTGCGENAHQQCARDAAAMTEENCAQAWKCPACFHDESDVEMPDADAGDAEIEEASTEVDNGTHLSHRPKVLGELVPAQLGNGVNDQSAPDELALDHYPLDDSRLQRKRKSGSTEPDEFMTPTVRKRRRPQANGKEHQEGSMPDGRTAESSRGATSRSVRLKIARPPPVSIEKRTRSSLVIRIEVRPGNLKEILSRKKRDRRRGGGGRSGGGSNSNAVGTGTGLSNARPQAQRSTPARPPTVTTQSMISTMPTPFTSDSYSQPFYSFFDKDTDDAKSRPYGGILTETEADTSKTLPSSEDRKKFEQAKQKAEDEWRARVLAMQAEADVPVRKAKKASDNASQIECIEFGGWEIDTWYAAPYPAEYSRNRVLYICEFCLKYMNSDYVAWRHKLKCGTKHPPGDEIYRHESVSIFEVDGRKHPVYCQNLCLLAKLFLGSKTLYYDVEPFLFYVLCEFDDTGYHFVGYFSKEKRASSQNNVSCILTLPIHQRKGYGNLLIDFSYLLTKVEEKTGSPEKPLSDMGLVSYRNYWRLELCRYFLRYMEGDRHKKEGLSIKKISDDSGMTADDVVSGLEGLRALVRDAQTQLYAFRVDLDYCRHYVGKWESKGYVKLEPSALAWTPYVMGRSNVVNFELGHPLNAIAPREDDEAKIEEGHPLSVPSKAVEAAAANRDDSAEKLQPEPELAAEAQQESVQDPETVTSIENSATEDKGSENTSPENDDLVMRDASPVLEPVTWMTPYKDIPASRFAIYPPPAGSRRADRPRSSVSRPPGSRTAGTSSARPRARPRVRPSTGSSACRPTASRPRTSAATSSRRKSGGTGRGPGRWPKGTKKSDYGNADSGPGLPPGWLEKQTQQRVPSLDEGNQAVSPSAAAPGPAVEEKPAQEEVRVSVMAVPKQAEGGKGAPEYSDDGPVCQGEAAADVAHAAEDVDAEGEDE